MKSRSALLAGLVSLSLVVAAVAADPDKHAAGGAKNAGFEKMKSLVGTWVAAGEDGKPTDQVVSVIRLTAGGSAIHETLFPDQPHEMISIYTADGDDVVMTHYCMLGNQPRMKASTKSLKDKLSFEFVGGGNLDPAKDKHMHAAVLTFVDGDHYEIEGIGWEDGKPSAEMCNGMKLVRQK